MWMSPPPGPLRPGRCLIRLYARRSGQLFLKRGERACVHRERQVVEVVNNIVDGAACATGLGGEASNKMTKTTIASLKQSWSRYACIQVKLDRASYVSLRL
jgi:hypothetical protein